MSWRPSRWIDAAELHARIGPGGWAAILERLAVPAEALRLRERQPCPICGGRDRYVFDDKWGRGGWFCRHCGAGDAFSLLERLHGWTHLQAIERICELTGIGRAPPVARATPRELVVSVAERAAQPTARVRELLRTACDPADVADVRNYLDSRGLWPLPQDCTLRAHAAAEYWNGPERIGRFAALLAPVVDVDGVLVTVHITYLEHGQKLASHEPRKLLSPLTGHVGCAVRLMAGGLTLGIAEGIETALAAYRLHAGLFPTWAAVNAGLLAKFEPPSSVERLAICADRDIAGLEAATRLMQRLQRRIELTMLTPPAPAKDWNDTLRGRA